jgi:hypothetical protein
MLREIQRGKVWNLCFFASLLLCVKSFAPMKNCRRLASRPTPVKSSKKKEAKNKTSLPLQLA